MHRVREPRWQLARTLIAVCVVLAAGLGAWTRVAQAAPQAGVAQAAVVPIGVPGVWVPVLMYHHIGNPIGHWPDSQFYVSPAAFEAQMAYLAEDGFASVSLEQ